METKTKTTSATVKQVYMLPKSACEFARNTSTADFGEFAGKPSELLKGGPHSFSSNSYRGNAGELYSVKSSVGTGRATCSCCGKKIAKGVACLVLGWQDSESYGYHLMRKSIHVTCESPRALLVCYHPDGSEVIGVYTFAKARELADAYEARLDSQARQFVTYAVEPAN